jgi:hypothetical protein
MIKCVRIVAVLAALSLLSAQAAIAQPGTGPRETVNQRFTAKKPGAVTGLGFKATFHEAGDPGGSPPYLERMVIDPPRGMRYDTRVPAQCSATDAELQAMGPGACPSGSRLGTGRAEGIFQVPVANGFTFDHFKHPTVMLNNTDEQILLVHSEGYTVARGEMRPNGSMVWNLPTCFPAPPTGCVDEYIVQLKTAIAIAPYKRTVNGHVRSYAKTPRKCPKRGFWRTKVQISWSNGKVDHVVSKQPCRDRRGR